MPKAEREIARWHDPPSQTVRASSWWDPLQLKRAVPSAGKHLPWMWRDEGARPRVVRPRVLISLQTCAGWQNVKTNTSDMLLPRTWTTLLLVRGIRCVCQQPWYPLAAAAVINAPLSTGCPLQPTGLPAIRQGESRHYKRQGGTMRPKLARTKNRKLLQEWKRKCKRD